MVVYHLFRQQFSMKQFDGSNSCLFAFLGCFYDRTIAASTVGTEIAINKDEIMMMMVGVVMLTDDHDNDGDNECREERW